MTALLFKSIKQAKKLVISVIGFTVLLIGLAMIVLPGPAFIVIPIALGILATEFIWAKRLLDRIKSKASNMREWVSKQ
jgi:tellurite resistance protein TerC